MTSEDHNQLFTIFRLISKSQSRGAARPCFVFCLFSNASHPAEQYLRKRDVEHLAIGSCFEDGDSYGDGPSVGVKYVLQMPRKDRQYSIDRSAVHASGTMKKTIRLPMFAAGRR